VFETISRNGVASISACKFIAFARRRTSRGGGRLLEEGLLLAMELSCWSFMRMAETSRAADEDGGALFTMTYNGSQMVVEHYNMMGP